MWEGEVWFREDGLWALEDLMVLEFETLSFICGVLAETYDGSSDEIRKGPLSFLDERLFENVVGFENGYLQWSSHFIDSYQNIHVYLWMFFYFIDRKREDHLVFSTGELK